MALFNINAQPVGNVTKITLGFGDPASNDAIVKEVSATLAGLNLMGQVALINGPASLPVAMVIAHAVIHRFGAVGVFDPKLGSYVCVASHGGSHTLGDLIPEPEVATV